MNAEVRGSLLGIRDELVCPMCHQLFTKPVSLPCSHMVCDLCARGALEGRGVYKSECPLCQVPTQVRDLHSNTKFAALTGLLLNFENSGGWGAEGLGGGAAGRREASHPAQEAGPAGGTEATAADATPFSAYDELLRWTERQAALGTPSDSQLAGLEADEEALRAGLAEVQLRLQQAADAEAPFREAHELLDGLQTKTLRRLCRHFKVSGAAKWTDARMRNALARQPCDTLRAVLAVED